MSVESILQQMAASAGTRLQRRADLWGGTIEGLSQIPGNLARDRERQQFIAEQRARQQGQDQRAANEDARRAQGDARDEAARVAQEQYTKIVNTGLTAAMGDSGDPTQFDAKAAFAAVSQLGRPEAIRDVIKTHQELQQKAVILKPGDVGIDPTTHQPIPGMSAPKEPKSMTPTDLAVLGMNANPVVSAFARGALNLSRAPAAPHPGQLVQGAGGAYQRVDENNAVTPVLGADGKPLVGYHPPASAGAGATGGLDEGGLDLLATQYRIQGTSAIPTRISGDDRVKLINLAAKQAKALGNSPAQVIQKQYALKSDGAALTKITTMASAAEAFETKAIAQAELVRGLSAKVKRTEYPLINAALQSGREATGNTDAHLFANGLLTFTTEYAKLMEGSTGSAAGSSDAARKDAARLIGTALNNGTIDKTLDQMKWEMQQTRRGYDVVVDGITRRMGGAPAKPPATPAAGNTYQLVNGQWVKQ